MKSLSLSQPHALVVIGVPGSGKTHFAEQFADTFNAPYLDIDAIHGIGTDTAAANKAVLSILTQFAKTKQSLVLEPAEGTRRERTEYVKLLKKLGYQPLYVWIQTDIPTARQRAKKAKDYSDNDLDAKFKAFAAPVRTEPQVVISGKHTYATQARVILKRLSAPRAEISTHRKPHARQGNIKIQ